MNFSWLEPLYTKGIPERQIRRNQLLLNRGCQVRNLWLIVLPEGEKNQLELYPAYALLNLYFPRGHVTVIGMAAGRKQAVELTVRLVEEAWQATGNCHVREYYQLLYAAGNHSEMPRHQKKTAEED